MRLWHQSLLPYLPRQQLLGQHRECCALRGKGWGKKHSVVNYVFEHPYKDLYAYHCIVMNEMEKRRFTPGKEWFDPTYRGRILKKEYPLFFFGVDMEKGVFPEKMYHLIIESDDPIYPEHDGAYLKECLENLKRKGIVISIEY